MSLVEHLEKLRHFHKTCDFPSIQSASRVAGISQAGLSKSIQSLEEALGVTLFLRTPQGLTLTQQGRMLKDVAARIFSEAQGYEAAVRALKANTHPETIRFGMYDSIAVYFYPNLSSYLAVIYPKVTLELRVEPSRLLFENVDKGLLDMAIGVEFQPRAKTQVFLPLFEDRYSFYVSSRLEEISEDLPLIFHPLASGSDQFTCESFLKPHLKRRNAARVFNFETVKALTAGGTGIGVLPTQVARPLVHQGILRQVTLPRLRSTFGPHTIGLLVRKEIYDSHTSFIEDIYRLGGNWVKI